MTNRDMSIRIEEVSTKCWFVIMRSELGIIGIDKDHIPKNGRLLVYEKSFKRMFREYYNKKRNIKWI